MTHPDTIGRYEVQAIAGEGGMGVVYQARDPKLSRTVAIKVLRTGLDTDERQRRFRREASALAQLQHPNIVTVYDFGEDREGHPFIVMEFVKGETLAQTISQGVALVPTRKLQLVEMLCAGLASAHRIGIVHRDIKPANLVVDSAGTLKILDFGIARWAETDRATVTKTGEIAGTPSYMSPEQILARPVGPATDQFAAAAVLYELLTYRRAFPGTGQEALNRILAANPEPLTDSCPDIHADVQDIVDRALRKDPNRRFPDMETMQRAIARARLRLDTSEQETVPVPGLRAPKSGSEAAAVERIADVGIDESAPTFGVLLGRAASTPSRRLGPILGVVGAASVVAWLLWSSRSVSRQATPVPPSTQPERTAALSGEPPGPAAGTTASWANRVARGDKAGARTTTAPANERLDLPQLISDVRLRIERGDTRSAFEIAQPAFQRHAADARVKSLVQDLIVRARTEARLARVSGIETGAPELAKGAFDTALRRERDAEGLSGAGRPAEAIAVYLEAEGLFRSASEAAARAATREAGAVALPQGSEAQPLAGRELDAHGSTPASTAAEEPGIRDALASYERAYEGLSAAAVKKVYPGLSAGEVRALDRTFLDYKSYDMALTNVTVSVRGDRATVQCVVEATIAPRDGTERHLVEPTTFFLEKLADSWAIVKVGRAR